jgi:hypothetical protein
VLFSINKKGAAGGLRLGTLLLRWVVARKPRSLALLGMTSFYDGGNTNGADRKACAAVFYPIYPEYQFGGGKSARFWTFIS